MATNKNFIVKNGLDVSGTANLSTLNLSGSLTGPATFTIDPAAIGDNTGTVVIAGNLQVDGTQTTINSTTMTVDDLNLTLASGAANAAAANGAGLTVDGSSATLLYANGDDSWAVNKRFKAQSDIRLGSDGVRLSTDGNGEFGVGMVKPLLIIDLQYIIILLLHLESYQTATLVLMNQVLVIDYILMAEVMMKQE